MLLLLATAAFASDYEVLRAEAAARGALLSGDTGVLIALAGEAGCLAAEDAEDCAASATPVAGDPRIELVPVPALALPPMGGVGPSLLLPRFPYGLQDPVTLLLGPVLPQPPAGAWVRVALPQGTALSPGPQQVQLLVRLDPIGPQVLPWASTAPSVSPSGLPSLSAESWGTPPTPLDRLQVLLPAGIAALRLPEAPDPLDLAWPEVPPEVPTQPLPESAWVLAAAERMAPAIELCARAWFAQRPTRRHPPVVPPDLPDPRMFIQLDSLGRVADVVPFDGPWAAPEPAACLAANLRLLPPAERDGAVDVLLLPRLRDARPPSEP